MRPELELISEWIRPGTRVLDLGCGDGALLAYLHERRQVSGYGLEIDSANIVKCIRAGVNVIHADLEAGLEDFGDSSFDYVIMTQTLQAVRHTERLLDEMLRVGRQGIVTFPNFGFWRGRLQVALFHCVVQGGAIGLKAGDIAGQAGSPQQQGAEANLLVLPSLAQEGETIHRKHVGIGQ